MIRPLTAVLLTVAAAVATVTVAVVASDQSDSSRTSATTAVATSSAAPSKHTNRYCLRLTTANELLQTQQPGAPKLTSLMCADDGAAARGEDIDGYVLFQLEGGDDGTGTWHFYGAGSDWAGSPACREMPRTIALNLTGCFNK